MDILYIVIIGAVLVGLLSALRKPPVKTAAKIRPRQIVKSHSRGGRFIYTIAYSVESA